MKTYVSVITRLYIKYFYSPFVVIVSPHYESYKVNTDWRISILNTKLFVIFDEITPFVLLWPLNTPLHSPRFLSVFFHFMEMFSTKDSLHSQVVDFYNLFLLISWRTQIKNYVFALSVFILKQIFTISWLNWIFFTLIFNIFVNLDFIFTIQRQRHPS